jgi:hypothetical protein
MRKIRILLVSALVLFPCAFLAGESIPQSTTWPGGQIYLFEWFRLASSRSISSAIPSSEA